MAEISTPKPERRRGPGRPFAPGQSGNPGGKPKAEAEVRRLSQEQTVPNIQALIRIRDDVNSPPVAVVAAVRELFDRGFGKPTQVNEHTGKDGGPIQHQQVEDTRPPLEQFLAEFSAVAKQESDDATRH